MYSNNKLIRDVADVAARIMSGQQPVTEKLHPNQQQLDVHEPEKDELTADDFKKLRAKKEVKKEEVESVEEADTLLARTGMNLPHKFPRSGQTNLGNIPAMNTPGNSKETDAYAEKRRGDRAKQLKPAIKAALGTHGPKGKLPEEVDLDEGKMGQLSADLKDLSHDDFHKEYGKPKSHYDPSNFKKPVQKGKEMDRAKSLAQRAMASMKKEEVEELDELSKTTLGSYTKKAFRSYANTAKRTDDIPADDNKASITLKNRDTGVKKAIDRLAKEEVEEIEEMFPGTPEYEKKYGKAPQDMKKGEKKKTTQGEMEKTEKGVVHKRKFSEMVESYSEGGVKGLFKTLAEEPTSAEFDAEIKKAQAKSEGKEKADVAKAAVQAVQNEQTHTTVEFIDYNDVNGVKYTEIDLEERKMSEPEMEKKEEIVKGMKKGLAGFKERYGKDAKSVMYATATKQAKGD